MQTLANVLLFAVAVGCFAWIARRLIGASRVGPIQVLAAALLGCSLGAAAGGALRRFGPEDDASVLATVAVVAVVGTMAAIVGIQLLRRPIPAGARRIGPLAAAQTSRRTVQVLRIAASHGLNAHWGRDSSSGAVNGAQLRAALEEAGVVFVKLGQALADRPDLVSPSIARELTQLQSQVAPLPRQDMEAQLRAAAPRAEQAFAAFDWEPLGSASIAQVYRATLVDGRDVIVKIRRPGVVEDVKRDSAVALNVAEVLERNAPWARQVGLSDVLRGLLADLARELDYAREAQAMVEVADAVRATGIRVPAPVTDLCSSAVLVMEFVPGTPLARIPPGGLVDPDAARALADAVLGPMLRGQRFHCDTHPGNVVVTPTGGLALIDFGSTAVLPPHEQASLRWLMLGIKLREPALMRDALLGVAEPVETVDYAALDRALAQLLAEYLPPSGGFDPRAVPALLDLSADAGLRMPGSAGLLFRALLTLLASLERLDPDYDLLQSAGDRADSFDMVPSSPGELRAFAQAEVLKAVPLLRRAPRLIDSVVTKVDRGELEFHVRMFSHERDVAVLNALVNRGLLVAIAGILGVVSVMLFGLEKGPYLAPNYSVYDLLGSIGLISGAVLLLRVLLDVLDPAPVGRSR